MTAEEMVKNFPSEVVKKVYGSSKDMKAFKGQGCKACHGTGYLGRIGLFEVLEVSNTIRRLITEKKDSDLITKAAIDEGMTTMLLDGLIKVREGTTTIDEILRVAKSEFLS